MSQIDLEYICTTIGNLSGIPVRVFQDQKQIFYFSQTYLSCDPMRLYEKDVFSIKDHVGYITTSFFHCYGVVNSKNVKIVIGGCRK